MTAAFELVDVIKTHRDGDTIVTALSGVSLVVESGRFVAVHGPSGSGKSTLLGVLGGLVTPTSGDARLFGASLVTMRDHHRTRHRRRNVGYVLQDPALVPRMSVLDNVLVPLVPDGAFGRREHARALQWLERLGVAHRRDTPAERLSGGEKQRVALARALVTDARCLLLDEPSAHLDAARTTALMGELVKLRDEAGCTVVVASHDPRVLDDPRIDQRFAMTEGRLA